MGKIIDESFRIRKILAEVLGAGLICGKDDGGIWPGSFPGHIPGRCRDRNRNRNRNSELGQLGVSITTTTTARLITTTRIGTGTGACARTILNRARGLHLRVEFAQPLTLEKPVADLSQIEAAAHEPSIRSSDSELI